MAGGFPNCLQARGPARFVPPLGGAEHLTELCFRQCLLGGLNLSKVPLSLRALEATFLSTRQGPAKVAVCVARLTQLTRLRLLWGVSQSERFPKPLLASTALQVLSLSRLDISSSRRGRMQALPSAISRLAHLRELSLPSSKVNCQQCFQTTFT